MNDYIAKHPYIFAIAIFVLNALIAAPFVIVVKVMGWELTPLQLIIPVAQSVVMLVILYRLGWWKSAGLGGMGKNIHLLLVPFAITFIPVALFGSIELAPSGLVFYTLAVLFTGVSEEAEARSLIVKGLLPQGIWVALFFSAFLFSVGHFSNLFVYDFSVLDMLEKLLMTASFAILYGALYLRTLNIWPLMALHGLHDFMYVVSGAAGPYQQTPIPFNIHVTVAVFCIALGCYLVRNLKADDVIAEMNALK